MSELIPVNDRCRNPDGIMNGIYTYLTMQNAWLAKGLRLYSDFGKMDTAEHITRRLLIRIQSHFMCEFKAAVEFPTCLFCQQDIIFFLFTSMDVFPSLYSFYRFHIFWFFRRNVLEFKIRLAYA